MCYNVKEVYALQNDGGKQTMDMNFDVNKVFQERLASSMGLDKYLFIMEQVNKTDIY